jgi:hypothetical protein
VRFKFCNSSIALSGTPPGLSKGVLIQVFVVAGFESPLRRPGQPDNPDRTTVANSVRRSNGTGFDYASRTSSA